MDLLTQLHRGNTRANRDRVASWVGSDKDRLHQLMAIYVNGNRREAQLAAGVLFSLLERDAASLEPLLPEVVRRMDEDGIHPAVRRVALRILMEVDCPRRLQDRVIDRCFTYLADLSEPVAIRVFAMGAIARLARTEPDLWNELEETIQLSLPYSSGAFQAHARKVMTMKKRHGARARNGI